MIRWSSLRVGLSLSVLVIVVDQAVKWWILQRIMQPPQVIEITSFFNVVMVWNRGVSFGLMNSGTTIHLWLLPLLAIAIAGGLSVWLAHTDRLRITFSLGLIIGGAMGNLIDRLRFGAVIDFLDFHLYGWHWPAFNVADAAISIGVVVLIADSLFGPQEHRKTRRRLERESGG